MSTPADLRAELQSLKISREQRPVRTATKSSGRRWLLPVVLLVLAALGGGYFVASRMGAMPALSVSGPPEVRLVPVIARQGKPAPTPILTASGKIVSDHRVLVFTKVSGQIVKLFFEQGDRVKAGQVMAEIEDVLFKARRDEARANLERAKANLEYQKVNFERVSRLHQRGTSPDIEFVGAQRDLDSAKAQVAADEASLAFMNKMLVDTKVVAPIEGVVLERNVNVGDFVAAEGGRGAMSNAQLGSIADMQLLRVEVDVSELDIARLKKDMPCTIIPDAYKERRYNGHVMWIDPGANYSKATVQVKVRIDNPDDFLRVEGVAQVAFLAARPDEDDSESAGLWIPKSACSIDSSGKTGKVFVGSDGRLKETTVQLGQQTGDQVQITGGLSAGQSIATGDLGTLQDGQRYSTPKS